MLTVKQRLLLDSLKILYNKIQRQDTILTEEYCKKIVKLTVDEIYRVNPDRNAGKIAVTWFDSKMNRTKNIDENTESFEIDFYDVHTGVPWLICRFFKQKAKVGIYCCS